MAPKLIEYQKRYLRKYSKGLINLIWGKGIDFRIQIAYLLPLKGTEGMKEKGK
jgi:hypothetical protein